MELIKKSGFDTALITNLSIYNKRLFQNILKFTEWCRVSLDTHKRQTYIKIRGVDMFDKVIANIKRLMGLKRRMRSRSTIGAQMVVCRENLKEVFNVIELASALKVDYVQVRPLETLPTDRIPYSKRDYGMVLSQFNRAKSFETPKFRIIFSNKWDIVNLKGKKKVHGFTFCHGYSLIGAIDTRGDYYTCCHKVEARDKRFRYGNVVREPIGLVMSRRKKAIKNLNLKECYLECRGSSLNRRLEGLLHRKEHMNFL